MVYIISQQAVSIFYLHKREAPLGGWAYPKGWYLPAIELIETPVLLFASCGPKYTCNAAFQLTTSCCNRKISAVKLRNHEIEIFVCPLHPLKLKWTLSHGFDVV